MASTGGYIPPEQEVRLLLNDHALSHNPPGPTVHPEVHALAKFRASNKGRIRVNKEVLATLKQVSAELDAAQRRYLAYKKYGEAGESILRISPDLVALPGDPPALAASASELAVAEGGEDQHTRCDADTHATGHGLRRWGYFPMLSQLRAVSAKPKKPPARPQQQLKDINAAAAQPAAAMATADEGADVPDSPKASWMQLVKQKKQAKEDSLAHMIRIRHAVLIIQRAWRAHIQKRASRALAMMMLRAKVRRAQRAAYVSNLLRRKSQGQQGGDGTQTADDDAKLDEEQLLAQADDVQLTAQEEAELSEALQRVLGEGSLSMADVDELQLTELVQKLKGTAAKQPDSSSEEEEEEPEQEGSGWKVLSKPSAPVRHGLAIRIDADNPSGNNWQGSLRTPGSARTPGGTRISHKLGSPDYLDDSSNNSTPSSRSSKHSRLSSGRSVSIRASGGEGSPSTPKWKSLAQQGGLAQSPRDRSLSRGKSGGVRVGRGVSVVLATADNAVAVAHGDGAVYIRAKSAARSLAHRAVSRFNPAAAAAATAAAAEEEYASAAAAAAGDVQLGHGNSSRPATPSSRLGTPSSSTGTPSAPQQAAGHAVAVSRSKNADTQQGVAAEGCGFTVASGVSGCLPSTAAAGCRVPLTPGGRPLSRLEFQRLHQGSPVPPDVAECIAAAAAEAAVAAAAVAAAEAATASGAEPGTPEWHEKQKQFHAKYQQQLQQQFEQEYYQQYLDEQFELYQQQCKQPQQVSCITAGLGDDAAAEEAAFGLESGGFAAAPFQQSAGSGSAATAAALAAGGRNNTSSPHSGSSVHQSRRNSTEASSNGHPGTAAEGPVVPHYALPLPPRSQGGDRRSSTGDAGIIPCLPSASHPGTAAAGSASRRATRDGPRGFCATSAPGGAFSKYERGLADGLQQEFRVLAAESALLASKGPSSVPLRSRKSDQGARSSCNGASLHASVDSLQQQQSVGNASSSSQAAGLQEQQQQQQQQHIYSRAVSSEPGPLFEGPEGFSYLSAPSGVGRWGASLAGNSNSSTEYTRAEAAAVLAAVAGVHQEQSAAAAAAASGRAAAAMQGLVLGPSGLWQQQQSRADSWFERLKAQQRLVRQPWDVAAAGSSKSGTAEGSGLHPGDSHARGLPSGKWGKRSSVHNAWLYIDGRAAVALPWQALAAATAAGHGKGSQDGSGDADAAAMAAAEAFLGPGRGSSGSHFTQLSVTGKRLLVKLMWLKSAAGVLRGLGRDAGVLERRVVQLLRDQTGPVGTELLLWSVADFKQQQQVEQQQQQLLYWHAQQPVRPEYNSALQLQQQGTGLFNYTYSPAPAAAAKSGTVVVDGELLGQHLPLLPAARSRALMSRPQGALSQQQLMLLAQQQQQQQQQLLQPPLPQQIGFFLHAPQGGVQEQVADQPWVQSQQLCQLQLQQQQLPGHPQCQVGTEAPAAATDQAPIAQRIRLAKRSRNKEGGVGAAAVIAAGMYVAGKLEQPSCSNNLVVDVHHHEIVEGNSGGIYAKEQAVTGWDGGGPGALALHGQRTVLLQPAITAHTQATSGFAGNRRRTAQQQQQQRPGPGASGISPFVPASAVQQLLEAIPQGVPVPQQQQQQGQLDARPMGAKPQLQLVAHAELLPPGLTAAQQSTAAGDDALPVCNAAAAKVQPQISQLQQGVQQQASAISFRSILAAAASSSKQVADESIEPVYVSFVASHRYQHQHEIKAQRRQTDGCLRPTRSTEYVELQQQAAGRPNLMQKLGSDWGHQPIQGLPVISPAAAAAAAAGTGGPTISAAHDHGSRSAATSPVPWAASSSNSTASMHQEQQQQRGLRRLGPRRVLRASLVGGLPLLPVTSLDGLTLLPESLQDITGQQHTQQQLQQSSQVLDMLLDQCHQQRRQQQQHPLGQRLDPVRISTSVACSVGCAVPSGTPSASGNPAAPQKGQQFQARHRTTVICNCLPPAGADNTKPGLAGVGAAGAAAATTVDGQWQAQRCGLNCKQKAGGAMLSVGQPQLPQLAALRVQNTG